ncbi:DUF6962 family protein [Membranihabitans marinus]|uniref:DUF6962 family protein n=1 Tax=Membranihabitans marinus TaxID=1227546 RepID=UPI001F29D38D|nr:hypothetical protein [Membranihabitans marinus]
MSFFALINVLTSLVFFAEQPSIYLGSLLVEQPVTTLTNIVVAAYCFYIYVRLSSTNTGDSSYSLWRSYFMLMGWSTLLGGIITHGFMYAFDELWKLPGWYLSMLASSILAYIVLRFNKNILPDSVYNIMLVVLILETMAVAYMTAANIKFLYVAIHSGFAMLIYVLGISIQGYRSDIARSIHIQLMLSVFATFLASVFFAAQWGISIWFNHVDMSHIFMYLGIYFLYKSASKMLQPSPFV